MAHDALRRFNRLHSMLLAAFVLFVGASTAGAAPIEINCSPSSPCIDFAHTSPAGIGGTVTYAGGAAPLIGTDIPVNRVFGFFTPSGTGPGDALVVEDGLLNFETGNFVSFVPLVGYTFGGGGSFTIVGSIADLGLVDATLAAGTFNEAYFLEGMFVRPMVIETTHPAIVDYFGMPQTPYFLGGYLTTEFVIATGGAFSTNATSLDLPSTPVDSTTAVPEPASLFLLGSGVVALATRAKRRKTRVNS